MGSIDGDGGPIPLINRKTVDHLFLDCLFSDERGDQCLSHSEVSLMDISADFSDARLDLHRTEIEDLLHMLPEEFHKPYGASINLGLHDRIHLLWTIDLWDVKRLFLLLLATKNIGLVFPESEWPILPGGRPYFVTKSS